MSIIIQGTTNYNGMDVSFVVSQREDKNIDIQISFINGSKKAENDFSFKQVDNNKWMLDRAEHESDIDVYFEKDKDNLILSASEPDIKLVYNTRLSDLYLVNRHGKKIFDFTKSRAFSRGHNSVNINFDSIFNEMSLFDKLIFGLYGVKNDVNDAFNDLFNKTKKRENILEGEFNSIDKPELLSKKVQEIKQFKTPEFQRELQRQKLLMASKIMEYANLLQEQSKKSLLPFYVMDNKLSNKYKFEDKQNTTPTFVEKLGKGNLNSFVQKIESNKKNLLNSSSLKR